TTTCGISAVPAVSSVVIDPRAGILRCSARPAAIRPGSLSTRGWTARSTARTAFGPTQPADARSAGPGGSAGPPGGDVQADVVDGGLGQPGLQPLEGRLGVPLP